MSLNDILPYLQTFNTIITVILNLSPIVAFISVIKGKEKYTNIPILMLVFNLLNNLCWGCYWHRISRFSPTLCSVICSIIATFFFIIYLYFFAKKNIKKFILYSFAFIFIEIIITSISYYATNNITYFGRFLIVINILMYIAPGQNLIRVIKEKNYKLIPIASTIAGALCSGGWFLFGKIVNDINCIIPNGLGLIFSLITTLVWIFYYFRTKIIQRKTKFHPEQNVTKDVEIQKI